MQKQQPIVSRLRTSDLLAEGLITIKEACKILSIGTTKLYRILDAPDGLPTVKMGKSRRIPRRAVMRYMQDRLNS